MIKHIEIIINLRNVLLFLRTFLTQMRTSEISLWSTKLSGLQIFCPKLKNSVYPHLLIAVFNSKVLS